MEPLVLLLVAFIIGLVAGLLSGMFGIGGGIVMVPAMIAAGLLGTIEPARQFSVATACSLFAIIFLSPTGSYVHMKANHLNVSYGLTLGVSGIFGGVIGSLFSHLAPEDWLEGGFAVFTIFMGIQMMLKNGRDRNSAKSPEKNSCTPENDKMGAPGPAARGPYGYLLALGLGAGMLAGTMGVGGGLVMVPVMVMLGVGIHVAIGTSLMAIIFTASASVATKAAIVPSLWPIFMTVAVPLAVGGCIAAYFGAKIAERTQSRKLARYFSVLLFFISAYMLVRALGYL